MPTDLCCFVHTHMHTGGSVGGESIGAMGGQEETELDEDFMIVEDSSDSEEEEESVEVSKRCSLWCALN